VNPAVLATLVGFIFFIASVRFPDSLYRTLDMTGDATTPISMIVIGAILARMDAKRILGKPRNYLTILFRLVLLPALIGAILYALGVRGLLFGLSVLITAMPVAASVSIMAEAYDGDGESASALVFVSILLSVATIPLVAWAIAGL
jgi:predicted permease